MQIKLINKYKPIFNERINGIMYEVLLDTGSIYSAFNGSKNTLLEIFPNLQDTNKKVELSGYGGNGNIYDIYVISYMKVHNIEIINMPIVIRDCSSMVKFVLSSMLFMNNEVSYNLSNSTLDIDVDKSHVIKCDFISNKGYSHLYKVEYTDISELFRIV